METAKFEIKKTYTSASVAYRIKKSLQKKYPEDMFFVLRKPNGTFIVDAWKKDEAWKNIVS